MSESFFDSLNESIKSLAREVAEETSDIVITSNVLFAAISELHGKNLGGEVYLDIVTTLKDAIGETMSDPSLDKAFPNNTLTKSDYRRLAIKEVAENILNEYRTAYDEEQRKAKAKAK